MAKIKKILVCGLNVHARHWVEGLLANGCEVTWAPTDSDLKANPNDLVLLACSELVGGLRASTKSIPLFYKERLVHRYGPAHDPSILTGHLPERWVDRVRALAIVSDVGPRLPTPTYGQSLIESLERPASLNNLPKMDAFQVVSRKTLNKWLLSTLKPKGLRILGHDQCVLSFSAPSSNELTAIYNAPFGQESFEAAYWASRTASLRVEGTDRSKSEKGNPFTFSSQGAMVDASLVSALPPVAFEIASNSAGAFFVDTGQWTTGAFNRLLVLHDGPQAWVQIDTLKVNEGATLGDEIYAPFAKIFHQLASVFEQLAPIELSDERVIDSRPETKINSVGSRLKILRTSLVELPPQQQAQLMVQELGL